MTGAELKALRQSVHLSQQALADALEVTQPTIARWERGKYGSHEEDPAGRKISPSHAKLIRIICAQLKKAEK